ncbi:MAG: segregation/condensation protein A [Pirellulaceae bacterium]|nr:segregation/condensation protein A [Pirellulaceae bacterium]
MPITSPFLIQLDSYQGPVDLLLYLVRKNEVEIGEIPLSLIIQQFFDYLDLLEQLHMDQAGEFLVTASILLEIKTKFLLPRQEEAELAEEVHLEKERLVEQLLEYKQFKDLASILGDQGEEQQKRFERQGVEVFSQKQGVADQPIQEVELWDLVSAFGRIIREKTKPPLPQTYSDDTPIHIFVEKLHQRIATSGKILLSDLFEDGQHKSTMIGIFLAVLELIRHHSVLALQEKDFGEIILTTGEDFKKELKLPHSQSDYSS